MNTKKILPLDSTMVDNATRTLRAYKHPYRFGIIGRLLNHGRLSSQELASHLDLDEPYVNEQLDILRESELITSEWHDREEYFEANEPKLLKVKKSVRSFFGPSRG